MENSQYFLLNALKNYGMNILKIIKIMEAMKIFLQQ